MNAPDANTILTIGHSNHPIERFVALLQMHAVTAIVDVRSQPHSRLFPAYNRQPLAEALKENGIAYAFLGRELGARAEDPACYVEGRVQYRRLAETALFKDGLRRVQKAMAAHRIALLCAEKEPLSILQANGETR